MTKKELKNLIKESYLEIQNKKVLKEETEGTYEDIPTELQNILKKAGIIKTEISGVTIYEANEKENWDTIMVRLKKNGPILTEKDIKILLHLNNVNLFLNQYPVSIGFRSYKK